MKPANKEYYINHPYEIAVSKINGSKYVTLESVRDDTNNVSNGNDKTGSNVGNYNLPIEETCVNCECKREKICYALSGCYLFPDNQATYAENLKFYLNHTSEEFIDSMVNEILENKWELFRYFTCGDIPDIRFVDCIVEIAKRCKGTKFWLYTKKYGIVNIWCNIHGVENIPENLVIIFSHWRNKDGSYFPMQNPYNFPTSEFIPLGEEHLIETVTHVCPCSDPDVLAQCKNCDHACYELKHGQSMALLEHSTKETKQRDKEIKAAKKKLKEEAKKAKGKAKKAS